MVQYRDENILVVSIGSKTTQAQFGLAESLTQAQAKVPSVVYKVPNPDGSNKPFFSSTGDEANAVWPLKEGKIVDLPAFEYLLQLMTQTMQKTKPEVPLAGCALFLVSSTLWSRLQLEHVTQYVFEEMNFPAFAAIPEAVCLTYAYNSPDAFIIDVGEDMTTLTPMTDFTIVEPAQIVIPLGASNVKKALGAKLPELTPAQIDALLKSDIYEVLHKDAKNLWSAMNQPDAPDRDEETSIDVAAIVASGKTREILAEREKNKKKETEIPNSEKNTNTFVDDDGVEHTVGQERFHGTEELVEAITEETDLSISFVDEFSKRQPIWNNIIIAGGMSGIHGFKEAIMASLTNKFLVARQSTYSELPSNFNTSGRNTPTVGGATTGGATPVNPLYSQALQTQVGHGQAPTSMRLAKMSEYFSEWKGSKLERAAFLGAQIGAKQIFGTNIEGAYISRQEYNEVGPVSVWDI